MNQWPFDSDRIKEHLCDIWKHEYPEQGCLPCYYSWEKVCISLSDVKYGTPTKISQDKIKEFIAIIKSGKQFPPLICFNGELIDGYHRYHAYKKLGITKNIEIYRNIK